MADNSSEPSSPGPSTNFDPSRYYSFNRMPQKRSLLRATSRDYEVYFTDIESVIDKLREIFNHLIKQLVEEINNDLPGYSHRIRMVLNAPSLNYPIHIPFSPFELFDVDIVLNEIDRVVNSNESFDISNNIKVNVLSVSLPSIGGKRIGGIHNRVVPDIQCFTKQKKSIITIHVADDENDCPLKALALGRVLHAKKEGKVKKNTNFYKASYQRSEMANFIEELRADEYLQNSSTVSQLVNNHQSTNSCGFSAKRRSTLADLEELCKSKALEQFCLSVYDRNFLGTFLKSYNSQSEKHIDLLYDSERGHVDLVTLLLLQLSQSSFFSQASLFS